MQQKVIYVDELGVGRRDTIELYYPALKSLSNELQKDTLIRGDELVTVMDRIKNILDETFEGTIIDSEEFYNTCGAINRMGMYIVSVNASLSPPKALD